MKRHAGVARRVQRRAGSRRRRPSPQPPPIAHAPKPITLTWRPVLPSLRYSMVILLVCRHQPIARAEPASGCRNVSPDGPNRRAIGLSVRVAGVGNVTPNTKAPRIRPADGRATGHNARNACLKPDAPEGRPGEWSEAPIVAIGRPCRCRPQRTWRERMAMALEQTVLADGRIELRPEVDAALGRWRASQRGARPGPDREAHLDDVQLPGAVGRHVDQHPDLAAGLRPDRRSG